MSASRRFDMYYSKVNRGQVICPLFKEFVIRGFTVAATFQLNGADAS